MVAPAGAHDRQAGRHRCNGSDCRARLFGRVVTIGKLRGRMQVLADGTRPSSPLPLIPVAHSRGADKLAI